MERLPLIERLKEKFLEFRAFLKGDSLIDSIVSTGKWLGLRTSEIFSVVAKDLDTGNVQSPTDSKMLNLSETIIERAKVVLQNLNFQKYVLGRRISSVAISNARTAATTAVSTSENLTSSNIQNVDSLTDSMAFSPGKPKLNSNGGELNLKKKDQKADIKHDHDFLDGLKELKAKKMNVKAEKLPDSSTESETLVKEIQPNEIKRKSKQTPAINPSLLRQRD